MIDESLLLSELEFKAVRSSGSGGQHVNKVSSKIILSFSLLASQALSENQKELLLVKLKNRLTSHDILILQCDDSRSQHKNKEIVIKRFLGMIYEGLKVSKKRKPTKVPKAVKLKRLSKKRQQSDKKANRKPPEFP